LDTSFNIQGASEPVNAIISGTLEDVKRNDMKFQFSNKQGLTETEIFSQLFGFGAVGDIAQGNVGAAAAQFSATALRGLFDPLTSRISSLLGLEELSFGIAGQSARGPIFKFTVRSNPFFFVDEYIEENLSQLGFLNRIRLRATGYLEEKSYYELGTSYRFNEFWALDYQYKQLES
ncbi:MAG TPA: translocation/assembly module TamB domain-containing protein, partial [Candidatus Obscuribacterales bacterium]